MAEGTGQLCDRALPSPALLSPSFPSPPLRDELTGPS